MTTTPLWVPLVVAGLGVLGTITGTVAGVVITQYHSDRREEKSWNRERQRERERWARDDAMRTFEERRSAYLEFYDSLQKMARQTWLYGRGLADEGAFEWKPPSLDSLHRLRVYASPEVAEAAAVAHDACMEWMRGNEDDDEYESQYKTAERALRTAMRSDLGIFGEIDDQRWHGYE